MDPPYGSGAEKNVLSFLSRSSIVKPESLIVAEADKKTDFGYVTELGFFVEKEKLYKTNKHVFIRKRSME